MPRFIVRLKDRKGDHHYLEWSTVVDAPVTQGMTKEDFIYYYRRKYGSEGDTTLEERMERVEKKGTSSLIDDSDEDVVLVNRAGPKESPLHYDEIVQFYCLGEDPKEDHPSWKERREEWNRIHEEKGGMTYEEINDYLNKWKGAYLRG
jgi:hypothetical protein